MAKALPAVETADTVLSGSSSENVQTNGIPDDGQSVSSTDNLVNNFTGCLCMDRKGGKFSHQLIQWDFEERRSRRLNVCVLVRFRKEAANSV